MAHKIKSDSNVHIPESAFLQGEVGKLYKKLPDCFSKSARLRSILVYAGMPGKKISCDSKTVNEVTDILKTIGRNNTVMSSNFNEKGDKIAKMVHSFMDELDPDDRKAFVGKIRSHKSIKTLTLDNVKDDTKAA